MYLASEAEMWLIFLIPKK